MLTPAAPRRRPGALQGAVDRDDRRVQQLGHLAGLPAQHIPQDQDRALARRQVLEGNDKGETDRFTVGRQLGRVAPGGTDPGVGNGQHPGGLRQGVRDHRGRRGRRTQVHRHGPALRALEHVDAHVGGDAVQPGPQGGPALEAVDAAPGPHHRLLHRIVGLEARAEHAVAVTGQLPPVRLKLLLVRLGAGLRVIAVGRHCPNVRKTADSQPRVLLRLAVILLIRQRRSSSLTRPGPLPWYGPAGWHEPVSHHVPGPVRPSGSFAEGRPILMDELIPGNMLTPQR